MLPWLQYSIILWTKYGATVPFWAIIEKLLLIFFVIIMHQITTITTYNQLNFTPSCLIFGQNIEWNQL